MEAEEQMDEGQNRKNGAAKKVEKGVRNQMEEWLHLRIGEEGTDL